MADEVGGDESDDVEGEEASLHIGVVVELVRGNS